MGRRALRGVVATTTVALAAGALAATAGSTITATDFAAVKIAAPPSVEFGDLQANPPTDGALESDTQVFVFDERQCVTLASDLVLDITTPGTYDSEASLTPGVIPAGTKVSSHFMHVDKVGHAPPFVELDGQITVDQDILGLAVTADTLDASDAALGAPGTVYPTGDFGRHLELDNARQTDYVIEFADLRRVFLHSDNRLHADQVRVVTKCKEVLGGQGCTPGYWKQPHHFDSWQVYQPTDQFNAVFGVNTFPGKTLAQALGTGGGGANALGRHAVAALLNAVHDSVAYGLDSSDVIAKVKAALQSGSKALIETTKNELAALNEKSCPLN